MMDGTGAPANQPTVPPHQQASLIRTDQVQKLPHLDGQQKQQHTHAVRSLWEILNNRDAQSPEYQSAHLKLTQLSQGLMKGMRQYQHSRQQQQQQQQQALRQQQAQAAAAAAASQGQRPQPTNSQSFAQLAPQIQLKVNSLPSFFLPPNIGKEQAQAWVSEARTRYGISLQKQELGKVRLGELRQQYQQRQSAGNMTQEDIQNFKNRQVAADKMLREGTEFITKFNEQQEQFKTASQNSQLNRGTVPAQGQPAQGGGDQPATPAAAGGDSRPMGVTPQAQPPAPHTINSAVNAARQQVGQAALSPATSQTSTAQTQASTSTVQQQTNASTTQVSFNQAASQQVDSAATPSTNTAQPANPQGPPRPLSHQAAMAQAAQNYSNNVNQQNVTQTAANAHAHPPGYIQHRSTEPTTRNVNMVIPKNLNVPQPEPVAMGPARPTLSGGPSHGTVGMMGQPAIQKHPGYVLEGEGQRVLSKKMLDILVRQVTGGGEEEGLTPDAEEFILQMADDFVDDVITAACRLAKLRPSSTLEIRDIQLVLERNYNMRISGFATDDIRTVKKPQPAQGWVQKMSAVQAAKVTQGKTE